MRAATSLDLRSNADYAQAIFEHHQGNVRYFSRAITRALVAGERAEGIAVLVQHRQTASMLAAEALTAWTRALDDLDAERMRRYRSSVLGPDA